MFEKSKLNKKIKALKKAVENGDTQAMYDLAMIYLDGTIVEKEPEKAFELLQQAADKGHLRAKAYLVSNKIFTGVSNGAKAITEIVKGIRDGGQS